MPKIYFFILCIACSLILNAQESTDTAKSNKSYQLIEVPIMEVRHTKGMGYLPEVHDGIVYSGKKTEVLLVDSMDANTAQNNPRQVLGRIPGAVFSETEGSGFPSNGVGFRGLDPTQSIETNTRMNGYNITADLFGYPETYFIPNLQAVQRIEVIRGASSLQFGPQFGGVVNYIIRDAPAKPFSFTTEQTTGSYGLFSSFNAIGGTYKWFSYYGYFQYTGVQGWRPNSDYRSFSGFGKIQFTPTKNFKISLEYSALRNRIHMAGGLTDDEFQMNSRASYRSRNWLQSPWNIGALKMEYQITPKVSLRLTSTLLASARDLVWRNEDGGPGVMDTVDRTTGAYINREVQRESFLSTTNELRLMADYNIGQTENTVAAGMRLFYGKMHRQGGGLGTTGSDPDYTLLDPKYGYDLNYTTINAAPFIENVFRVTRQFSITPGFRFEYVNSTVKGYITDAGGTIVNSDKSKSRYIPLAGIGFQYKTTSNTSVYTNWSQAYKPTDYSQLTPLGSTSVIDPNLKDANGFNADLGFRGAIRNYLSFDIGGFYLQYNKRIGLIEKTDSMGNPYTYRTNVADSRHLGVETYIEFNPVKAFTQVSKYGTVSFFNSFSYIDARYINGMYKGNFVENAPRFVERFGLTYAVHGFSVTMNVSHTAQSFSDADNTVLSPDAVVGIVPAYTVLDLSATYRFLKYFNVKAGTIPTTASGLNTVLAASEKDCAV